MEMRSAKLILGRLWPVLAVAGLLVLAQRLAVEGYWETHPEARLQAEIQRPAVEKALIKLREQRQNAAQSDKLDRWKSTNASAETEQAGPN